MGFVQTKELVTFLKANHGRNLGFINRIKSAYRPYICPYDDLLNLLPDNQNLIDIGCGLGTFLLLVALTRKPRSLAGLEIKPALIDLARSSLDQYAGNIRIRVEPYNGTDLPNWLDEYEYTFLIDVLHHVPKEDQQPFLTSLFHHLKSGSMLIIKEIDAQERFWYLFNKLHDLVVSHEVGNELTVTELERNLRQIGFQILRTLKKRLYVYPHYTVVCKKP